MGVVRGSGQWLPSQGVGARRPALLSSCLCSGSLAG